MSVAFPTIIINNSTGSDTAASGAGPGDGTTAGSALTGSAAATDSAGTTVTLDGSPDLAAVATDGSHAIWLSNATAGARNWARITAKDNTAKTVTVAEAFAVSLAGKSWAIGGKRAAIGSASSIRLLDNNNAAGDAMPGWIVQLDDGHAETYGATAGPAADGRLILRRAGDTTSGPVVLRGKPGATTRPVLTFAGNVQMLVLLTNYQQAGGIDLRNTNATKTASMGVRPIGNILLLYDLRIADATGPVWRGIDLSSTAPNGLIVRNCEIASCASHGINLPLASTGVRIAECRVHNCGGAGISVSSDTPGLVIIGNALYANTGANIAISGLGNAAARQFLIQGNTLDGSAAAGLDINQANDALAGARVVNNLLTNNVGGGLKFSHASATDTLLAAEGVLVAGNQTYGNTAAAYISATAGYASTACPWATGDTGLNPTYTNAGTGDFSIGTNLKAQGYPTANLGLGAARSYVDPGAYQRQEPAGGGGGGGFRRVTMDGGF
jgi:hypothetical protein